MSNARDDRASSPDTRARRSDGVATRQRIFHTASALFASGGYEATSLRQIASAAGIDTATLKYHFGDKASLFSEIYRVGHSGLITHLKPRVLEFKQVTDRDALLVALEDFVFSLHDFAEEHYDFVRMLLYRMLEGSHDIIHLEEELQGLAMEMFDETCHHLYRKGLIRVIDHRALLSLLLSSFTMWFVVAEARPQWIQEPSPFNAEGRRRSETFFTDLLERLLLP